MLCTLYSPPQVVQLVLFISASPRAHSYVERLNANHFHGIHGKLDPQTMVEASILRSVHRFKTPCRSFRPNPSNQSNHWLQKIMVRNCLSDHPFGRVQLGLGYVSWDIADIQPHKCQVVHIFEPSILPDFVSRG